MDYTDCQAIKCNNYVPWLKPCVLYFLLKKITRIKTDCTDCQAIKCNTLFTIAKTLCTLFLIPYS